MSSDFGEFEISEDVCNQLKNEQWLKNAIFAGKTPQEIVGFSEGTMNKFYEAACHLFETKRYEEASNAFLFLVTMNSFHYDYWLGLGSSLQSCGDHETAIDAYELAAICSLDNPVPYIHLAKCLFAMHDRDSALQAIELALEYSADLEEYGDIYKQALAAKALLIKDKGGEEKGHGR